MVTVRIQLDGDVRGDGERLMHCAAVRHFQELLLLLRRQAMRQVDDYMDLPDAMRGFSHYPFGVYAQPFP